MKIYGFVLCVFIVALVFILMTHSAPKTPTAGINGRIFSLYLAKTPKEQEIGLSKFNQIAKDKGMLFIFPRKDYLTFWMKGMKFPIDIIFIQENKIVDIFQDVPVATGSALPTYTTKKQADKVLEINAGLVKEYGIKIGDHVNINL